MLAEHLGVDRTSADVHGHDDQEADDLGMAQGRQSCNAAAERVATAFSPTVALATVVGPLIEVPVMLALVWGAMRFRPRLFGATPSIAPTTKQVAPEFSPR